jgi:plastocyanin
MLVLVAICAVPAVSAAQDSGTPADVATTTATTTPGPDTPPAQPVDPSGQDGQKPAGQDAGQAETSQPSSSAPTFPDDPTTVTRASGKAHAASSATVTMGDFFFSPGTVTIDTGDTVTWKNTGQAPHNATGNGGSFSTSTINGGQSTSHTFSSAGTFNYICTIHPNMRGTVRVLSASGSAGGGSSSSSSSGTSEASAVASPDAAGNSTTLPMTGMAVGALALVGAALVASGLLTRWAASARHWLSPF